MRLGDDDGAGGRAVGRDVTGAGRRAVNHLTVVKLALQILERRTSLTADQRRLVEAALGASGRLSEELLTGPPFFRPGARSAVLRADLFIDGVLPPAEGPAPSP